MARQALMLVATLSAIACAAPAAAAPIELGVQDDPLVVRLPSAFGGFGADRLLAPERVDAALGALRVDTVRINVPWAQVAGSQPDDPLLLDRYETAVDRVVAAGRRVQLTLSGPAPRWATADGRVSAHAPSARRYAAFAGAVAQRFRGRVARYSIWNEPNWWSLLRPRRHAARIYRRLFLRGAAAVRAADPGAHVLIGELAPLGRPEAATPPLRFLRRLTCSDARWRARPGTRCPRLAADGFAHHPYSLRWAPEYPGPGREDVTTGSLRRLTRALDALARRRALATPRGGSLPLYLTEWGYHARSVRVREPQRSAYVRRGLQLAARVRRVRQVVWYQLAGPPRAAHVSWDTGLLGPRGTPRPVFGAVRGWSRARARRLRPPVAVPAAARAPRPIPGARAPYAVRPVAAADGAGHAAIAWVRGSALQLSRRIGGRFRRPRTVAAGVGPDYQGAQGELAVRGGDALIAWARNDRSRPAEPEDRFGPCCERVRALLVDRRGRRTGPRLLSPAGSEAWPEAVAIGAGRRLAVARSDYVRGPRVHIGRARRGFGRAERVPGLQANDRVLEAWFRRGRLHVLADDGAGPVVLRRAGRGRWTRTVARVKGFVAASAVSPSGVQAVLVRSEQGEHLVASRRPGGRFRVTRVGMELIGPTLALSPAGRVLVAWNTEHGVRFVSARAGRGLGRVRRVRGRHPGQVAARAARDGRIALTWRDFDQEGRFGLRGLVARPTGPLRPRWITRASPSALQPADGAPLFLRGRPVAILNRATRISTARMR